MNLFNRYYRHPVFSIICIFLGASFGHFFPAGGIMLAPVGELFLSLFKMCALPIVITVVIESFYKLMNREDRRSFIARTFSLFGFSMLFCASFGMILGSQFVDHLVNSPHLMAFLSGRVAEQPHGAAQEVQDITGFFIHLIPQNIFKALSDGQVISCLIFFALLGTALAKIKNQEREKLHDLVKVLKESLFMILSWCLRFLPLAVFAIFAKNFSGVEAADAGNIIQFTLIGLCPVLGVFLLQWLTILIFRSKRLKVTWSAMKAPLTVAFSTSSSIVSLPLAMEEMTEKGKVQRWLAETVMPLSVTFNQQASVAFCTFTVTLCTKLFGIAMGWKMLVLIGFGGIVQGICSSGLPALANLGTMTMIFSPLGLPMEVTQALLLMVIPFLSPFISATNVMGHAWSGVMLERRADPNFRKADLP